MIEVQKYIIQRLNCIVELVRNCYRIRRNFQMKQQEGGLPRIMNEITNSKPNRLAKMLYRNNSHKKLRENGNEFSYLNNINPDSSILGSSLSKSKSSKTLLIPSISLKRNREMELSQRSMEISQGKILLSKLDDQSIFGSRKSSGFNTLSKSSSSKKKALFRRIEGCDSINEKRIIPDDLLGSSSDGGETTVMDSCSQSKSKEMSKTFMGSKVSRRHQESIMNSTSIAEENDSLTPGDFIQLVQEDGSIVNEFCYLKKMNHAYDLKIVEFEDRLSDQSASRGSTMKSSAMSGENEYITISSRGVTYFSKENSRFVPLEEWKKEAGYFSKLMQLEFFSKYSLFKNFAKWKKYIRKTAMKSTTDRLKNELLTNDRFLRRAMLQARSHCFTMEHDINYCKFDDCEGVMHFGRFKATQDQFIQNEFEKRIAHIEEDIKKGLVVNMSESMKEFKEENKISTSNEGKGIPLLIGDEKNLEMPYTKEATLRTQQEKFKKFLRLIEFIVVDSKIKMMSESTQSLVSKVDDENASYCTHVLETNYKLPFKGKQYLECFVSLNSETESLSLKPTREEINFMFEDIVNKSIIKLCRNHKRLSNDDDILEIIYDCNEKVVKEPETNILKMIITADERQEKIVEVLNGSINTAYSYIQQYSQKFNFLIEIYFANLRKLEEIDCLAAKDHEVIKSSLDGWRDQLQEISSMSQEHEAAIFLLNFREFKEKAIRCVVECQEKMKRVIPEIFRSTTQSLLEELKQCLVKIGVKPTDIESFIEFQENKNGITNAMEEYADRLAEISCIWIIMKSHASSSEMSAVAKQEREIHLIQTNLNFLRTKLEEAEMNSKVFETRAQGQVKDLIPTIREGIYRLYEKVRGSKFSVNSSIQEVMLVIEAQEREFEAILKFIEQIHTYQRILSMEAYSDDTVRKFDCYFQNYKSIWAFRRDIIAYQEQILQQPWALINVPQAKAEVQSFIAGALRLKKKITSPTTEEEEYKIQMSDIDVLSLVFLEAKSMKPLIETIECLRDKSLGDKEFKEIKTHFEKIGKSELCPLIDSENESVTVEEIQRSRVTEELDFIQGVVFKSKKQMEIQNKMLQVNKFWVEGNGHNAGKSLADNFEKHYWDIITEIDEKITVINGISEEGQGEGQELRQNISHNKAMFDTLRTLLVHWEAHQRYFRYFEPIFLNAYWKGTNEFAIYSAAEKAWKTLLKKCKDYSLKKWASNEKAVEVLKENIKLFEELKKAVEDFLTSKREVFAKFHFLSNEELLYILLEEKDFRSVEKHLNKTFDCLKSLDLREENSSPVGVTNLSSEYLPLRLSKASNLEIEEMFKVLDESIKTSVRSSLRTCLATFERDEFSRKAWTKENLLQVLLFIQQSEYTKIIEFDYLSTDGEDLSNYLIYQNSQVRELQTYLKEEANSEGLEPRKIETLIIQELRNREITEELLQNRVFEEESFHWQRQIRSYYTIDSALTKFFINEIDYGNEFVSVENSYQRMVLSEKEVVDLANAMALRYCPVVRGRSSLFENFAKINAKYSSRVVCEESMAEKYILNTCMGTFLTGSFVQFEKVENLTLSQISLVMNFLKEIDSSLHRKQKVMTVGLRRSPINQHSGIIFRLSNLGRSEAFFSNMSKEWRSLQFSNISISGYVSMILEVYKHEGKTTGLKVDKIVRVINQLQGAEVLDFESIKEALQNFELLGSEKMRIEQYLCQQLCSIIAKKVTSNKHIALYHKMIYETLLEAVIPESQCSEFSGSSKISREKSDMKYSINYLVELTEKKSTCIISGPTQSGKIMMIREAYRQKVSRENEAEILNIDIINLEALLGCYETGLWKEGILLKKLKQLQFYQQEWIVFEGSCSKKVNRVLSKVSGKEIQLSNGELVTISPKWKFIFCLTDWNQNESPQNVETVFSNKFVSNEEALEVMLEKRLKGYFSKNLDCYNQLSNTCINNFEKVMGLLKVIGFKNVFTKTENILRYFVNILEALLKGVLPETLSSKDFSKAIEKIFLWSIYWCVGSGVPQVNSQKYEKSLFELIKTDFERSQNLSLLKLSLESPQGSFVKIKGAETLQIDGEVYLEELQLKSKASFCELMLAQNFPIILIGLSGAGKSKFMQYFSSKLNAEKYSTLRVNLRRGMTYQEFKDVLFKKTRVSIRHTKRKCLCSSNGKKLVIMLDDFNFLDLNSQVGEFVSSCIRNSFYYDFSTNEKIFLHEVSFMVAENSSHEFRLENKILKYFQPIYINEIDLKNIADAYKQQMPEVEYAREALESCVSLHNFVMNLQSAGELQSPQIVSQKSAVKLMRKIKGCRSPEKLPVLWSYISQKEYIESSSGSQCHGKIKHEISNLLNLMIQNSPQVPQPVPNIEDLFEQIEEKCKVITVDSQYKNYYEYLAFLLAFKEPQNTLCIGEPLPESIKSSVLSHLADAYSLKFFYCNSVRQLRKCEERDALIYLSSTEKCQLYEMIGFLSNNSESKHSRFIFDCKDSESFADLLRSFPSLPTLFNVFSKTQQTLDKILSEKQEKAIRDLQNQTNCPLDKRDYVKVVSEVLVNQELIKKTIEKKSKEFDKFLKKHEQMQSQVKKNACLIEKIQEQMKSLLMQEQQMFEKKKQINERMVTIKNNRITNQDEEERKEQLRKVQSELSDLQEDLKKQKKIKNQKGQLLSNTQGINTLFGEVLDKLTPHLQSYSELYETVKKIERFSETVVVLISLMKIAVNEQRQQWKEFVTQTFKHCTEVDLCTVMKYLFDVNILGSDSLFLWALYERNCVIVDKNSLFSRLVQRATETSKKYRNIEDLLYEAAINEPKFYHGDSIEDALRVPQTSVYLTAEQAKQIIGFKKIIFIDKVEKNGVFGLQASLFKHFEPTLTQQIENWRQQVIRMSVQRREEAERIYQCVSESKEFTSKVLNDIKRECNINSSTEQRLLPSVQQLESLSNEREASQAGNLSLCEMISEFLNQVEELFPYFSVDPSEVLKMMTIAKADRKVQPIEDSEKVEVPIEHSSQKQLKSCSTQKDIEKAESAVVPSFQEITQSMIEQAWRLVMLGLKAEDALVAYLALSGLVNEHFHQISRAHSRTVVEAFNSKFWNAPNPDKLTGAQPLRQQIELCSEASLSKEILQGYQELYLSVLEQRQNVTEKIISFSNRCTGLDFYQTLRGKMIRIPESLPSEKDFVVVSNANEKGLSTLEQSIFGSDNSTNWCCLFENQVDMDKISELSDRNQCQCFVLIDLRKTSLIEKALSSQREFRFIYYYSSVQNYLPVKKLFFKENSSTESPLFVYSEQEVTLSQSVMRAYSTSLQQFSLQKPVFEKLLRVVFYEDVNALLFSNLNSFERRANCQEVADNFFYDTKTAGAILKDIKTLTMDHFLKICQQILFRDRPDKQKMLLKEAQKIFKKDQNLNRSIMPFMVQDSSSSEQPQFDGSNFVNQSQERVLQVLSKVEPSTDFINMLLPSFVKKKYSLDSLFLKGSPYPRTHFRSDQTLQSQNPMILTQTARKIDTILNNFPSLLGMQILEPKREKLIYKEIIREEARKCFIQIKAIQDSLKSYKNSLESNKIMSKQTIEGLESMYKYGHPTELREICCNTPNIEEFINKSMKRLESLEVFYCGKEVQKMVDVEAYSEPSVFIKFYLYESNGQNRLNLLNYDVQARVFNEKDREAHFEQAEPCRGLTLAEVGLRNVKYDQNRNMLESHEKAESKLTNIHVCLMEASHQHHQNQHPITFKQEVIANLQCLNKLKEDSIWKEKASIEMHCD